MNNKIFTITILIASFFLVGSAYAVSQSTSQKAGNSSIVQTQESQVINQEIVKRQNNQQIQENLNGLGFSNKYRRACKMKQENHFKFKTRERISKFKIVNNKEI